MVTTENEEGKLAEDRTQSLWLHVAGEKAKGWRRLCGKEAGVQEEAERHGEKAQCASGSHMARGKGNGSR